MGFRVSFLLVVWLLFQITSLVPKAITPSSVLKVTKEKWQDSDKLEPTDFGLYTVDSCSDTECLVYTISGESWGCFREMLIASAPLNSHTVSINLVRCKKEHDGGLLTFNWGTPAYSVALSWSKMKAAAAKTCVGASSRVRLEPSFKKEDGFPRFLVDADGVRGLFRSNLNTSGSLAIYMHHVTVPCNSVSSCGAQLRTKDDGKSTISVKLDASHFSKVKVIGDDIDIVKGCRGDCSFEIKGIGDYKVICPDGAEIHLVGPKVQKFECPGIDVGWYSYIAHTSCRASHSPVIFIIWIVFALVGLAVVRIFFRAGTILSSICIDYMTYAYDKLKCEKTICATCEDEIPSEYLKKCHGWCKSGICPYCTVHHNESQLKQHVQSCPKKWDFIKEERVRFLTEKTKFDYKNSFGVATVNLHLPVMVYLVVLITLTVLAARPVMALETSDAELSSLLYGHQHDLSYIDSIEASVKLCGENCWSSDLECKCPDVSFSYAGDNCEAIYLPQTANASNIHRDTLEFIHSLSYLFNLVEDNEFIVVGDNSVEVAMSVESKQRPNFEDDDAERNSSRNKREVPQDISSFHRLCNARRCIKTAANLTDISHAKLTKVLQNTRVKAILSEAINNLESSSLKQDGVVLSSEVRKALKRELMNNTPLLTSDIVLKSDVEHNFEVQTSWGVVSIESNWKPTYNDRTISVQWTNQEETDTSVVLYGTNQATFELIQSTGLTWTAKTPLSNEKVNIHLSLFDYYQEYNFQVKYFTSDRQINTQMDATCTGDCLDCDKQSGAYRSKWDGSRKWNCNKSWCWAIDQGCTCCKASLAKGYEKHIMAVIDTEYVGTSMIFCLDKEHPDSVCKVIKHIDTMSVEGLNAQFSLPSGISARLPKTIGVYYSTKDGIPNMKQYTEIYSDPPVCLEGSCSHGSLGDFQVPNMAGITSPKQGSYNLFFDGVSSSFTCHTGDWPTCNFFSLQKVLEGPFETMIKNSPPLSRSFTILNVEAKEGKGNDKASFNFKVRPKVSGGQITVDLTIEGMSLKLNKEGAPKITTFTINSCSGCVGCITGFDCEAEISIEGDEERNIHLITNDDMITTSDISYSVSSQARDIKIKAFSIRDVKEIKLCVEEAPRICSETKNINLKPLSQVIVNKTNQIYARAEDKCTDSGFQCWLSGLGNIFKGVWSFITGIFSNWKYALIAIILILFFIFVAPILVTCCRNAGKAGIRLSKGKRINRFHSKPEGVEKHHNTSVKQKEHEK